jgi:hypothetical protein
MGEFNATAVGFLGEGIEPLGEAAKLVGHNFLPSEKAELGGMPLRGY